MNGEDTQPEIWPQCDFCEGEVVEEIVDSRRRSFCGKECEAAYEVRIALDPDTYRHCMGCPEFWPPNVSECPACGSQRNILVNVKEQLP